MADLEVKAGRRSVRGEIWLWRQPDGIYVAIDGVKEPLTFKAGDGRRHEILDTALRRIGK